jgi:hypothetical protein
MYGQVGVYMGVKVMRKNKNMVGDKREMNKNGIFQFAVILGYWIIKL